MELFKGTGIMYGERIKAEVPKYITPVKVSAEIPSYFRGRLKTLARENNMAMYELAGKIIVEFIEKADKDDYLVENLNKRKKQWDIEVMFT